MWVHYWLFHVDSEWLGCVIFDFVFILFLTTFFLLKGGWTVLHLAAARGFEQIVKILVEHGSNVNLQTSVLIFFFLDFFIYLFICFSHFFICCCGFIVGYFLLIVNGWAVIFILFLFFFNNFLFVKEWNDCSSLCC